MNSLRTGIRWVVQAVFPESCVLCSASGSFVCRSCLARIELDVLLACPLCELPRPQGRVCDGCAKRSPLVGMVAATRYAEDGVLAQIIHAIKYHGAERHTEIITDLLTDSHIWSSLAAYAPIAVVPIPLHPRRKAERGFNQTERLAEVIGAELGIPVLHVLCRRRYTKKQSWLHKQERTQNVHKAFSLDTNILKKAQKTGLFPLQRGMNTSGVHTYVAPPTVLLVDDVYTTGSTMNAAAEVLVELGVQVVGVALARGI